MSNQQILLIDDERGISDPLSYALRKEGFEVTCSYDGQDGLRRAQSLLPDLIILDLMLPLIEGLEVCRQLRGDPRTREIPVLMLTARTEEIDEVVGFNMGADDYVTKPFKMKPLVQRVKALLRRPHLKEQSVDVVSRQGITLDRLHHRAVAEESELPLTPTEFKLLWTLLRQPGRTFNRNELMDASRGEDANAFERTIDVHVRSLRQKLGARAVLVETVRGVGYRFRDEPHESIPPEATAI
ncbi:MAG: two component transcriptional regulator, winged helix family [Planctomycetaceae bacterium]|nr:two component transcriptional regulator, winged helix family [Planctomycetaceae bacterium]